MAFQCEKRSLTLVWSILECIFFSGILNGWIWLQQIFKEDNYFVGNCSIPGYPNNAGDLMSRTGPVSTPPYIITYSGQQRYICVRQRVRIIQHGNMISTTAATTKEVEMTSAQEFVSQNSTDVACLEQDDNLELLISLTFIIRNILMLPLGIFLDKYGTSRTRIVAM